MMKTRYVYKRGSSGVAETWNIFDTSFGRETSMVSIPLGEAGRKTEATARLIVDALNLYDQKTRGQETELGKFLAQLKSSLMSTIDADTFDWYLDILPPRWMQGGEFMHAEGLESFRLFWRAKGGHYCRHLTEEETQQFCRLARVSRLG